MNKFFWLLTMAWRDSRNSRGRLALFTSSIILGVAALVAIDSFEYNLRQDIQNEANGLLGADLSMRSNRAFTDSAQQLLDSLGGVQAEERSFGSMAYFPKSEDSKFAQVRALRGKFPFYGRLETIPQEAGRAFLQGGPRALVDQTLMLQYGLEAGDSVRVGQQMFEIAGRLLSVPGQNSFTSTVATPIYIPLDYLQATGLVQKGSRIRYQRYFYFEEPRPDLDEWLEDHQQRIRELSLRYDTVESRKEDLRDSFGRLTDFLNLVGFVALLLGCVGVASAVEVYMREKINTVAVLRCLGVKGGQAFLIFLLQVGIMGFLGSVAGAILGSELQRLLPWVLADFLPVEASTRFSLDALLQGVGTGTLIALLFALLSLLRIRQISPLAALRAAYDPPKSGDPWRYLVMLGIGAFVFGFSYLQVGQWQGAVAFTAALGVSFLLLLGTGRLVMWAVRRFFPAQANYLWRQALANLYRPHNQTLILIVSIGLGTGLIATLAFVQSLLLSQVDLNRGSETPNLVLIDVQSDEVKPLLELAEEKRVEVVGSTPIVTMRTSRIKGRTRAKILADTARKIDRWVLDYEFRVSYRDTLMSSEEVVAGEWIPRTDADGISEPIPISVAQDFADDDAYVEVGDEIVWDVQGLQLKTYVASMRKIDMTQMQGVFIILFPAGVLEDAPQFSILSLRAIGPTRSAAYQRAVAKRFPTVSVLDLKAFLNTAEAILDKISFVIRFMAMFSILTGLIVLAGSVVISRYQRMREGVLLRTLGASRRQILTINALEYLLLGGLATGSGILLALTGSYLLAIFTFKVAFFIDPWPLLILLGGISGLTVLIGLLNSRGIVNHPPLEVLRRELE
jgi:putative ABC transport system permease protein